MTFNSHLKKEILPGVAGGIGLLLAVAPAAFALTDTTPPSTPGSLSASSVSSSQINLSWSGSNDDNAVTGYEILRNGTEIGTTQNTSYADTGLQAGMSYSYLIEAYDAAGNRSNPSNSVSTTTVGDNTDPSTPTNLSATAVSSSQINLAWSASNDNLGVTGYKVYRNGNQVGTTQNTSYADTGLNASTNYSYTIAAYDAAGNTSSRSNSISAATLSSNSNSNPNSNNGATTTVSVPPTIDIGANGNVLVHGLKVTSVGSNSVTGTVWGITYTTQIGSAQFLSQNAGSSSFSSIQVGDVLGVEGSISPNSPTTIQAQVVRDYSTIAPQQNHSNPGFPLPPIGIGPIRLPNPIPFFGQIRLPF